MDKWYSQTFLDIKGRYVSADNRFDTVDVFEDKFERLLIGWIQDRGFVPRGLVWDYEILKLSPSPGLLPYDRDRWSVYFGRTYAIQQAKDQLASIIKTIPNPPLFVIGASGSGKSSLVRAGLLPTLVAPGAASGVDMWRWAIAEPSTKNMETLAERIFRALPELKAGPQPTAASWAELARRSPEAATETVRWVLRSVGQAEQQRTKEERLPVVGLLLVIDQLEGLFGDTEQGAYTAVLRSLVTDANVWLLLTIRSDRYPDLQHDDNLLFLKRLGATYDLPPPGPAEITDIIRGPARSAGLEFERKDGASLFETLRASVPNADALPLLQMTLAQLFEARTGTLLTYRAYDAMGGIEGAIAAHANSIYDKLSPQARRALPTMIRYFIRMLVGERMESFGSPRRALTSTQ